jgi:hypothetical protein
MVPRSSLLGQDQLVPSTAPLMCGHRSGSPATGEEQLGTVRSFLCSRIIGDTAIVCFQCSDRELRLLARYGAPAYEEGGWHTTLLSVTMHIRIRRQVNGSSANDLCPDRSRCTSTSISCF